MLRLGHELAAGLSLDLNRLSGHGGDPLLWAYPVADIKVYSNADSVELTVNGVPVGTISAPQCEQRTCLFKNVRLATGESSVVAVGNHGGSQVSDTVQWSLTARDVNIAAGRLATGLVTSAGARFGSDHFFSGGRYGPEAREASAIDVFAQAGDTPVGANIADVLLYQNYRLGHFTYEIPLADGRYEVTLGSLEPNTSHKPGDRVFKVTANGRTVLDKVDILAEVKDVRTPLRKTFMVDVSGGGLTLDFDRINGEAIVSEIRIGRQK